MLNAKSAHVNKGCVNVTQKGAINRFRGETKDSLKISIVDKHLGAQLGR